MSEIILKKTKKCDEGAVTTTFDVTTPVEFLFSGDGNAVIERGGNIVGHINDNEPIYLADILDTYTITISGVCNQSSVSVTEVAPQQVDFEQLSIHREPTCYTSVTQGVGEFDGILVVTYEDDVEVSRHIETLAGVLVVDGIVTKCLESYNYEQLVNITGGFLPETCIAVLRLSDGRIIRMSDNMVIDQTGLTFEESSNENCCGEDPLPFIMSALTTTPDETFTILTSNVGTFNALVDWGDGSTSEITTWDDVDLTHTYSVAATNQITISGTFPSFFFNNGGDVTKIVSIENLGEIGLLELQSAFYGASNLVTVTNTKSDTSLVTNFLNAWRSSINLVSFPLIDTSSGTNFISAWNDCIILVSFPLIDTSSATNLNGSWKNCSSLISFPLIDTSSVTLISNAWSGCTAITTFPLIDTSSATDFFNTWLNNSSLVSFPLIDTSSAISLNSTWSGCTSLLSFPLIDTSSATSLVATWDGCTGLTSFPLIDTSSVSNFGAAWRGCTGLTSFPLIDTSSATSLIQAWFNCTSLTSFPPNMFNLTSANAFTNSFTNCALDQVSVDNILVSIELAGTSSGTLDIDGGASSTPSATGLAAILDPGKLNDRLWTVTTN